MRSIWRSDAEKETCTPSICCGTRSRTGRIRRCPTHARPLAPRGRREAKRIAKHLRRRGIEPTLVLCSSAERTRQTLELIRPALGGAPVQIEDGLYAAANDQLLERLRVLPEQSASVLVIGHNPGLQELALVLATPSRARLRLEAKFPMAALATLAVQHATWAQPAAGDAELTQSADRSV